MASKTTTGTKTTRSTAKQAPKTATAAPAADQVAEVKAPVKAREIDIHEYIPVRNGFQGVLVYTSKRTGETFIWEHFGDEQEIELQELKNAKASSKTFFERNWFMFDDEYAWVIDWLGVRAYYRNALNLEEFDEVFTLSADQIFERVSGLSDGQKVSLGYRARQKIANGEIDSNRAIAALEEALGTQLVER